MTPETRPIIAINIMALVFVGCVDFLDFKV
jgi:hypothetical protein